MVYYRFRARAAVQVGFTNYAAGEEIVLSEADAKKWISKADFQNGKLVFAGEMGGEEPIFSDSNSRSYKDSKAKQDGAYAPMSFDIITVPVFIDLSAADLSGLAANDKWWTIAPCDCTFEGFELTTINPSALGVYNYDFDVRVTNNSAWKTGTASGSLLEQAGFRKQPAKNVLVGAGYSFTDYTIAANSPTSAASGTVDLGLAASGTEYVYVGFWDKFVGLYFDIDTTNTEASTVKVQYPKVTGSGTITWTDMTVVDTTTNAQVLDQDGSMTWEKPSDWARTIVSSGSGKWYYVRLYESAGTALTAGADAGPIWVIENKLTSYDNPSFINAGDKITIKQNSTGTATGLYPGVMYLRRMN